MALMKFKRSAVPAKVPSIADLALGELAINTYDGKLYLKKDDGTQAIVEVGSGGGGGSGTVTSVDASGGTTGLSFTGGPITTSGTLTLGGTLGIANGGTGATDAATARANLSAAVLGANGDITSLTGITGGISSPDFVQFDTAATVTPATGRLFFNDGEGGLAYTLKGGNVIQEVGQSQQVLVYNGTGATLTKGQVVYSNGAQGQRPTVALALATGDATSARTLGIVAESIADGAEGWVTTFGIIENINTSAFTEGAQLYLSGTTAGALTATKPVAPLHMVYVARCIKSNASSGRLFVTVQNGYEMDELHDVSAVSPANNDGLFYNTSTSLWEKKSIATALGYTPYNASNPDGYITSSALSPYLTSATAATTYQPLDGDLTAIAALAGTAGLVRKTAANTYTLDTATYLTGITSLQVTTALGFTPYNATNPAGYTTNVGTVTQVDGTGTVSGLTLTGSVTTSGSLTLGGTLSLTSGNVTTALGFTPYDAANPSGYTSNTGTVTSVGGTGTVNGITLTGSVTASGNLTLGGTLSGVDLTSQVTGTLPVANGGTGVTTSTGTGNVVLSTSPALSKAVLNDGYTEEVFAITDGAVSLDPNNGSIQTWTLGANRTPDQANWAAGQSITLMIDDGAAYTITWSTLNPVWETNGGSAPTLALTGYTVIVLWKVGTTIYGARVGDA